MSDNKRDTGQQQDRQEQDRQSPQPEQQINRPPLRVSTTPFLTGPVRERVRPKRRSPPQST